MRIPRVCWYKHNIAPEILNDLGYDTKADIYSAGIILYTLLTGISPFYGKTYDEVLFKNKRAIVDYPEHAWSNVSIKGKELVQMMLQADPKKRPSAEECLKHRWFIAESVNYSTNSLAGAIENIKKYSLQ